MFILRHYGVSSRKMNKYLKDATPCIILSVISVIVFFNTVSNAFVYDDSVTVVHNSLIKNWKNIHSLFSFHYFMLSGELSYRPVVTLSYFIDYFLWGLNPVGFHLTNIFLHAGNTILFYFFLKRVVKANTSAFIAALLFTTHPVLTETLNSVSYREDILAALFFLIAFIMFLKIDEKSLTPGKFVLYYAVALLSYLLSLFSKETSVVLPILMVLFHVFCSSSTNTLHAIIKRAKWSYLGYFIITGFYLFVRFVLFRHVYIRLDQSKQTLFVMIKVFASYIKLLFLPFNLNADYVVPSVTPGIASFVVSALLISTAIILILRVCQHGKRYWFFPLWFFITLLPVSNIIPIGNIMAERYLYIPIMGFCGVIGMLIQNCISGKNLATIGFVVIIIIASITSIYRNGIWRDEFTLWYSTVNREPGSVRAHLNLGVVHNAKGFYDYAELEYKKTLEINPRDIEAHYNMGNVYERKGMLDAAIKEYHETLRYNPVHADAYNNLGSIYKNKHLFDRAIEFYKKAKQCNPFNLHYYNNLGLVYRENRLYDEALMEYKRAIELDPDNLDAHNNLGIVYVGMERINDAAVEFETATQLDPKVANVHNNLGIVHAKQGNPDKAIRELNKAVSLGFDNADVHNNLAGVYLTQGSTDRAIAELKLALTCNPADCNAHSNLGIAYISKGRGDEAISEFTEAIKYNPADGEIHYYLGNALYRKGHYAAAADAFCQSVYYQPNNPLAHKMLGIMYANYLNNFSGALFHLGETLRLDPQQSMAKELNEIIDKLRKQSNQ